jgi:hypothetical protein
MSNETMIPDLYELAFMPGRFRCPKCDFQLSKQTMFMQSGSIGISESNLESEPCPNDGTPMVHVTYKEQLGAYSVRLDQELRRNDIRTPTEMSLQEAGRRCHAGDISIEALFDWMTKDGEQVSLCSDFNAITPSWTCAWIIDGVRYSHEDASMRSAINGVIVKCFMDAIKHRDIQEKEEAP